MGVWRGTDFRYIERPPIPFFYPRRGDRATSEEKTGDARFLRIREQLDRVARQRAESLGLTQVPRSIRHLFRKPNDRNDEEDS